MAFVSGETVRGWIVIEDSSSRFIGIFETEQEAQLEAGLRGPGYVFGPGTKERDTDSYQMDQRLA